MMYSREEIAAAARRKGHTEEEIRRILAGVGRLKQHGLVKTNGVGTNVGLTAAGRSKLAELRANGMLPRR